MRGWCLHFMAFGGVRGHEKSNLARSSLNSDRESLRRTEKLFEYSLKSAATNILSTILKACLAACIFVGCVTWRARAYTNSRQLRLLRKSISSNQSQACYERSRKWHWFQGQKNPGWRKSVYWPLPLPFAFHVLCYSFGHVDTSSAFGFGFAILIFYFHPSNNPFFLFFFPTAHF